MSDQPPDLITVHSVLRQVWEADCYPVLGSSDCAEAERLEKEALARAPFAVSCPGDPPGFRHLLAALINPDSRHPGRDEIMDTPMSSSTPIIPGRMKAGPLKLVD